MKGTVLLSMKEKLRALVNRIKTLPTLLKRIKAPSDEPKPLPKFRFHKNFWILIVLIPFALLFTQALISPVSAVIFVFIILLPIISLVYMLLGALFIKLYLDSSATEVEKMSEVSFSLALSNESPIPFPFVEAVITIPGDNAVRSDSQLTMLSLISMGSYVIDKTVKFKYRGAYDIGVSDLFIHDFFHFFSLRVEINLFRQIFVLPRHLIMPERGYEDIAIENTETVIRMAGSDNTETTDIRAYISGDSLRSIHWKLSEKTEELMVKQYSQNSETQTYILCDTARRYDAEDKRLENDINEFAVDGVVEAAIAIVGKYLEKPNNTVTLAWFDQRSSSDICALRFASMQEFEQSYRFFASSPVTYTQKTLLDLFTEAGSVSPESTAVICVTGAPDRSFSANVSAIRAAISSDIDAYIFTPAEKVAPSYAQQFYSEVEACASALSKQGVSVYSAHFDVASALTNRRKEDNDDEKE